MGTKKPNTKEIVRIAKEKSLKTRRNVEKTISELSLSGNEVNFNSVAKSSGVSKSWLYNNPDIRKRIESLRNQTIINNRVVDSKRSKKSEETLIKTLKERIKSLEKENKALKNEIETLYGNLYSKINS